MHQLLNTLYVQTQGAYLRLDHDTLRAEAEGKELIQVPLHHLGGIAVFGNVLLSPFLIHRCAEDQRTITWYGTNGRFRGRLHGPTTGNVLLRRAQHDAHARPDHALALAKRFVGGKIRNGRHVLQRGLRDGVPSSAAGDTETALATLAELAVQADAARTLDELRGIEGNAAAAYFAAFPQLLRVPEISFEGRNRRPPRDPANALLSFAYTLLANECASACEGVGLDPQVGFLHALRPGRAALALDLMEELRHPLADRAVLTLLNRRQITRDHFEDRPGGAVLLNDEGRREFLRHWQTRKQEEIQHPILSARVPLGLLPHVQARLLARHLRGDTETYAPFLAR